VDELADLARRLREQARARGERRLIVLHGEHEATRRAAGEALAAADVDRRERLLVGPDTEPRIEAERLRRTRSKQALGTTWTSLVLDAHEAFDPNALGRTLGAVDGGGLYLLLVPPLAAWPDRQDAFDSTLAVAPFSVDDVAGRFRRRLVATMRGQPGIAIVDADTGTIDQPGLTETQPDPTEDDRRPEPPRRPSFPEAIYRACRTQDQADTVHALEGLLDPNRIVVVDADRGRGKSSAAGLAAAGLLARGKDVLVTAPRPSNVEEVFARARELATELDLDPHEAEGPALSVDGSQLAYASPIEARERVDEVDAVVVDEAAGIPVHVLAGFLDTRTPIAFTTTIHGYEGAGRGFSVRLQDHLDASDRPVHRLAMDEPIRYARQDPVEAFGFEALLLDAAPARADQLPAEGTQAARYRRPSAETLLEEPDLLREAFGLLVLAHYRTTPADLARLLDAPNVSVHWLTLDGHVVSVALVAREGGLPADRREVMYEGERVPGNLIPDVLTSQLRDEDAAKTTGWRVMRVATHPARRREGFATRLLEHVREEAEGEVDWLGTSYGATPELLSFWHQLGYRTMHLSTRRNEASGEHSALQLSPITEAGHELADRTERWLVRRLPSGLADALDQLDPDVVRASLAGVQQPPEIDLTDRDWRLVAAAAYGSGVYDISPRPFRQLALRHLVDQGVDLAERQERLLVRKVLQAHDWDRVHAELGYDSKRMAMRDLGEAYQPIVDAYGNDAAHAEAERFR
jgi:tRNA(Met) cytidine acetyltransferase